MYLRYGRSCINYRMLYFFFGTTAAVLSRGLAKSQAVPAREIGLALRRKAAFISDPETHTFEEKPS